VVKKIFLLNAAKILSSLHILKVFFVVVVVGGKSTPAVPLQLLH
jgi:hypothetical protein